MNFKFIFDHHLKQWPTGRKRGKDRNAKNWISRERKELFRWNKKDFLQILKGYHLVKNEKLVKIADTSFDSFYEVFFEKLGFIPCIAKQPLQGMEFQEKEAQKD